MLPKGINSASEPARRFAFCLGSSGGKTFLALLHTAHEPRAEEWQAYMDLLTADLPAAPGTLHWFVVTDGGGPNAAQRQQLGNVLQTKQGELWSHIFTTDRLVRGIVTALRWIAGARAIAHLPTEFAAVCRDCGVPVEGVSAALVELQSSLPEVRTLTVIRSLLSQVPIARAR